MFGLDTLDLLREHKPIRRPKLRRGFLYAAAPVVAVSVVIGGPGLVQSLSGDYSGLVMFLVALAINVLISLALGYMAYHANRNRMGF